MAAIDYASTLASLDAALATATGADATLGQEIRDRLAKLGARLTKWFDADASTAKTAWVTLATAAFNEAEEAAAFVYDQAGEPAPGNISFNQYSSAELLARLADAAALTSDTFLSRALTQHRSAFVAAFNGTDDTSDYTAPIPRHVEGGFVLGPDDAVATIEREFYALIQGDAASWLALAAF